MKKNILKMAVVALAVFAMPTMMHAQLGNLARKAKSATQTAKTLTTNENLIGTEEIKVAQLAATWSYTEAGVSFAAGNAAEKAAGNALAQEVEPDLRNALSVIRPGMLKFKFNEDKTCQLLAQNKPIDGTYTISGPDITVNLSNPATTLKFNGRLDGNRIQLSMTPDELTSFIKAALPESADSYASKIGTVTSALEKAKNLYLALWFFK
jgi:hypothetical protein